MTDILSKIQDDIDEYEALCKKYNEEVVETWTFNTKTPDCYGPHAQSLLERKRREERTGQWTGWR